ncbi:MAG: hypothetical protein LIO87_08755 [Eubacterium sp.]|nr:hypothetical protein [Eubacterium sp.]
MTGYSARIKEASKELTKKEQVIMKDTSDCLKLDEETTTNGSIIINPGLWAIVEIHNEKSDNKEYLNYIVQDADTGMKYVTGSESFWTSFMDIMNEMADSDEEFQIKVYRGNSKNYAGKQFLACAII